MNRHDIYYPIVHAYSDTDLKQQVNRYQEFDSSFIPGLVKKSLGLKVTKITPSSDWGLVHVIYFLKTKGSNLDLLFRANTGPKNPEKYMLVEKLVTDRVAKFDIPVNKILVADVSRKVYPFDYQIHQKLPGQVIEDHFTGTKTEYDNLSTQLGEIVAKFHRLNFDNFGFFDENLAEATGQLKGLQSTFYAYLTNNLEGDIEDLHQAKIISAKVAQAIQQIFIDHQSLCDIKTGCLIHHDLADHNITYKNNTITGIFDWEVCSVGDPVLDIASCPTWKTYHPRLKPFLAGYTKISSLPHDFEAKSQLYLLRTMLWKTVNGLKRNLLTPDRLNRLKEALAAYNLKLNSK